MVFDFIRYRKIFYGISLVLVSLSLYLIFSYGFKFGIDFTGGSIMELEFQDRLLPNSEIEEKLADLNLGGIVVQPTQDNRVILRMKSIDEATHEEVLNRLENAKEHRFEGIGPVSGKDLTKKTQSAVIIALVAIGFYIMFAFGRLNNPAKPWQYSMVIIVTLFHNLLIPLGVFAFLGKFHNVEITIPIVAALLTILTYSLHDTIVVFDRIRENLLKRKYTFFGETINQSLIQTLSRSINTGVTFLLALLAIYFFGGETLKDFSLMLIIGVMVGTYSSIFIASPLIFSWTEWQKVKKSNS